MENQFSQEYFHRIRNTNQNDINDDDPPCPPPGLDRFVTGQTVSLDDRPNAPTFGRVVTGEGMSSRVPARTMPASTHNNNFFNDNSPQDFFDSYLNEASVHEESKTVNQPVRNKYPHMFPSSSSDRREIFLPHVPLPANAFNQADSKNTNASFYQTPSPFGQPASKSMGNVQYNSNAQPQRPADSTSNFFSRPDNDQNIGMKEKTAISHNYAVETTKTEPRSAEIPSNRMAVEGSCDETSYTKSVPLNQANYGFDTRDGYPQQDLQRMPQTAVDQTDSKIATSSYQSFSNAEPLADFQPRPAAYVVDNAQLEGNEEKAIGAGEEVESKHELPANRMAVEGSCGNAEIPYTRPAPASTPNKSMNYKPRYANSSKNSFPEDSRQTRDDVYGGETSSTGVQGVPRQLPPSANAAHFADVPIIHSKTPSSLSNGSSTNNELSNYDNFNADLRRDRSSTAAEHLDNRNAAKRDVRVNSSVADEKSASCSDLEDRSIETRTVIGYNNNTIPRRKHEKLTGEMKSNPRNSRKEPPFEQRMVVGETSSDALPSRQPASDADGRPTRSKADQFATRGEKLRKKQPYGDRKDRRKVESDEESDDDDEEFDYKNYDDDCRDRYRQSPPKMYRKGQRRKPTESSKYRFNDYDSDDYYDDDDYDYFYKSRPKYASRAPTKETSYQRDPYSRPYANSRKAVDHHRYAYDDSFSVSSRNSRPSSRSQIKCPDVYEPLNPYRLVRENKLDKRELRKRVDLWKTDLPKYVLWFRNTFENDYLMWYRRYYEPSVRMSANNERERRGSGHSDRNSVNGDRMMVGVNERSFFKPVDAEASVMRESRYTPMKYQGAHAKGVFNSLGQLVLIEGNRAEGDRSTRVEIYRLSPPDDADWREFLKYPGPFIVGETRPNTVCDLLTKRIEESRQSSEKLLYLLIKLIIRGVSDGAAVSEILNESYEREGGGGADTMQEVAQVEPTADDLSQNEILSRYTNLLLQGSQDSALDWAVEHELWGHAIFLASRIVTSRYREVLSKFKANISANSPLKTLYQLYLDEIPQVASACRDEKWADWRPHLAMILSNRAPDSEQHKEAIVTMGDSLASKDVFAAQFCYVAADLVFDAPSGGRSTKFSLLGSATNAHQLDTHTPNSVILLTQMYEYAKRLQRREFTIVDLAPYKYLLATRLFTYGNGEAALQYLQSIASDATKEWCDQYAQLARNVVNLSERIAYAGSSAHGATTTDRASWLQDFKRFVEEKSNEPRMYDEKASFRPAQPTGGVPPVAAPQSVPLMFTAPPSNVVGQRSNLLTMPLLGGNQAWQGSTVAAAPPIPAANLSGAGFQRPTQLGATNTNDAPMDECEPSALQQSNAYEPEGYASPWSAPQQPISISMHSSNSYFNDGAAASNGETASSSSKTAAGNRQEATAENTTTEEKKPQDNGNGWLTGFVAKFKRTNVTVAKLPDDTDISFQYDHDKGQWVDKNRKDGESNAMRELPPPKAAQTFRMQPNDGDQQPSTAVGAQHMRPAGPHAPSFGDQPPSATSGTGNMYTLSRGRGMKANYVNVLSTSTAGRFPNNVPSVTPPATMTNSFPGA